MPQSLRAALLAWDTRDVAEGERLFDSHSESRTFPARLAPLCLEPETEIAATWMLKRHFDLGGGPPTAHVVASLYAGCERIDAWEARLHFLQCVGRMPAPLAHASEAMRLIERCLDDENKFVRAWALDALVEHAEAHAAHRVAARARVDAATERESAASVRARLRAIRRRKSLWLNQSTD